MSSLLKSLPVGYRFHPTDQEIVNHYLKFKNLGYHHYVTNIPQIDVCKWEPWNLSEHLGSESADEKWYFFGRRDPKYEKSTRTNRATGEGFWKPTGKDRYIRTSGSNQVIGTKKTLVFYRKSSQKSIRTRWVMHEFRASADLHNPQAFAFYMLKKKTDENTDGAVQNKSSSSSVLINNVPLNSPLAPTAHQGLENFPSPYSEDDDTIMQGFVDFFNGEPTWEALEERFPAIPSNKLNVSNSDPGVTHLQNINRHEEVVNSINSRTANFVKSPESDQYDSESSTITDNYVPQLPFGEDTVYGGSAYLSESESSDQEFYNDLILAHELSLSGNSEVIQHVELKEDKECHSKLVSSEGIGGSVISNMKARPYSEVLAQASGVGKYENLQLKRIGSKRHEAVSKGSSVESLNEPKSSRHHEVGGSKSNGELGKKSNNMRFIFYAENTRVSNETSPSNYIINIAIGIILIVVITGEALSWLVR